MDKKDVVYEIEEQELKVVREAHAEYKAEPRFTYKDYCTWPEDDRWELIDGIPFKMEAPSEYHQQISGNLFFALRGYLTGKSCKAYHAPFDVRLHIDGIQDTVVQPDVLVICDLDILDQKGAKGAPDLVIEILSPSNYGKDRILKLAKYEKHGVKELWMIDPVEQVVYVYILNKFKRYNRPVIYQRSDGAIKATVLEDFKISFEHIFTRENIANNELFEQGARQNKLETAKRLLAMGLSIEAVAKGADLDLEVVRQLA